jgi:serine/threonine protein kinase/tetratricopeptide (TPR) repeat protein
VCVEFLLDVGRLLLSDLAERRLDVCLPKSTCQRAIRVVTIIGDPPAGIVARFAMSASADQNLLFGILAVQLDFISYDALIAAMNVWQLDKNKPLGDILLDWGQFSSDRLQLLTALVGEYLRKHGDDPRQGLAALSSLPQTLWQRLAAVSDEGLQESITWVASGRSSGPEPRLSPTIPMPKENARYRILRPHAKGGLGEVFVAEDTELGRHVALKEIQDRFAHDPESRVRFVREAQITGGLEHPGIVPVYGLGTYGDGRPFYAMRFIKGDNLKEAIRRFHGVLDSSPARRFDSVEFRQLLQRFIDVCNAVAYAHSRGVLHRDLKPGNIMLGKYGETLVVDWGLAKPTRWSVRNEGGTDEATFQPRSGSTSSATVVGLALGTPAYMSPEQSAGRWDDLGPASDVYSLGATLYELLTSKPPFSEWNPGAIQRGDFPSPRAVVPAVPRALEAIARRAMAPKPADRYVSAVDLAKEIERWLADEPVTAWTEPATAQMRRWMRKHSRSVTGAVAALVVGSVALAGGLTAVERQRQLTAVQEREAARERDQKAAALAVSQKRLAQVERGIDILTSVFTDLDPRNEEKDGKPLRYLLSQQLDRATEQLTGEAVGDPLAVARLQNQLGQAQLRLGAAPQAIRLFEAARATFTAQFGPDHADTLLSTNNLASGYHEVGRLDQALPIYEETFKRRRATLGPNHPDTLRSMGDLARGYHDAGQLKNALPLYEEALKKTRAELGPDHRDTLTAMNNLALGYQQAGQRDKALLVYEEALKLLRSKLGPDHTDTLSCMNNLARSYHEANQLDKALPLLKEVLELTRAKLGPDHPNTIISMGNLASGYQAAAQLDNALPLYEETLRLCRAKLGSDHPHTLTAMNNLALGYEDAGRLDKALPLYEETFKKKRANLGPDHPNTLNSMNNLAAGYLAAGQLDKSLPLFEETLTRMRSKHGSEHPVTLDSMGNLAGAYLAARQPQNALPIFLEFLTGQKKRLGEDLRFAGIQASVAAALIKSNEYIAAEPILRECLAIREKLDSDAWTTFDTMSMLGASLIGQKKYAEAEPLLLGGCEGMMQRQDKIPKTSWGQMTDAQNRLVQLYNATGSKEKADAWRARLAGLLWDIADVPAK